MEDYMCHIFSFEQAEDAGKHRTWDFVKDYGETGDNIPYHTGEKGERYLLRCRRCGKLVMQQRSEVFEKGISYYEYFPMESESDADKWNKYSGEEILEQFPKKYLKCANGAWTWSK